MAIENVYAVEVSGACNLENICAWCPMHNRPRSRKRGLMSDETVERALYWVEKLNKYNPSEPLHLHNFGEPLLHPKFDEIAARFAKVINISVSTNGVLLDEEWAVRLSRIPWHSIGVSPWNPHAQTKAAKLLSDRNIRVMFPPGVVHNWGGQSKDGDHVTLFKGCHYLQQKRCVIRWDGSITTCCITDREEDVIGHIDEEPEDVNVRAYSLCETCHHAK